MSSGSCPVCGGSFPMDSLPNHVEDCLSGGGGGAVGRAPRSPLPPSSPAYVAPPPRSPSSVAAGIWWCSACTLRNEPSAVACAVCDTPRPEPSVGASSSSSGAGGDGAGGAGATAPDDPSGDSDMEDADAALARRLADEEQAAARVSSVKCGMCSKSCDVASLFILDECSHKFCRECIKSYVGRKIVTEVTVVCPLEGCAKPLSVRDTKELLPEVKPGKGGSMVPAGHTDKAATERIFQELKHITKSKPEQHGYSVKPVKDNLYMWEVRFFGFDKSEPLAQDLEARKDKEILLHCMFPKDYPFGPPFIRVIRPRFRYRSGHVTVGGSICTEMLTRSGWTPTQSMEATLISIRTNLIVGGARLDPGKHADYSEAEAREAYARMVREHGWE